MGRKKKVDVFVKVSNMEKPKLKIGTLVTVMFLGTNMKCEILELTKNPLEPERWVYKVKSIPNNTIISYVGVNGSEKYANIYT